MSVNVGMPEPIRSSQLQARLVASVDEPEPKPLDARALVERYAGDAVSVLGIAGAGVLLASRRAPRATAVGEALVKGSVEAAIVDTAIQTHNVLSDGGDGAVERGNPRSDLGTIAYAATGLIPAASLTALSSLRGRPGPRDLARVAALAANAAVMGYEVSTRGSDMAAGTENASGYASFVAAMGGFVVSAGR